MALPRVSADRRVAKDNVASSGPKAQGKGATRTIDGMSLEDIQGTLTAV